MAAQNQRLGLGTVQFGIDYGIANSSGQVIPAEAAQIIKYARIHGSKTLDTAIGYGNSEATLGEIGVSDFDVVTKIPPYPRAIDGPEAWLEAHVAESLRRLKLDSLYAVMLHRASDLLLSDGRQLYEALLRLREVGTVEKIGVSIYAPEELDVLCEKYTFDIVQAPFNLIDRRLYSSGWLARLKDQDVEVHTRSVFLQGLLLMPMDTIPLKFARWLNLFAEWHAWLNENNCSAVAGCLQYPLSFPEIDCMIVGSDSLPQWQANTEAVQSVRPVPFPDIACNDLELINPVFWGDLGKT